jgi:hypothetical protein
LTEKTKGASPKPSPKTEECCISITSFYAIWGHKDRMFKPKFKQVKDILII